MTPEEAKQWIDLAVSFALPAAVGFLITIVIAMLVLERLTRK